MLIILYPKSELIFFKYILYFIYTGFAANGDLSVQEVCDTKIKTTIYNYVAAQVYIDGHNFDLLSTMYRI